MGEPDLRSHLDRLTDAASRLLEGRSVTEVARETGLGSTELEELRRKILRLGVAAPETTGSGLRRSGPFLQRIAAALGWRHAGPGQDSRPVEPGPVAAGPRSAWSPWQPVPAVAGIEARVAREPAPEGVRGVLWHYEFRSTLSHPVSFRYRVAGEAGGEYPRSVRALRPGEVSAGTILLTSTGPVWVGTSAGGL